MALNELLKNKVEQNIKCYHYKIKNENCYAFILGEKFRISYNGKTLVISDEGASVKLPKDKSRKEIPFKDGIKKAISMETKKKNSTLFPIEGYIFIQEIMAEFSKIKPKEPNPIPCNGG